MPDASHLLPVSMPPAHYIRSVKMQPQLYWLFPVIWGLWIIYLSLLPAGAGLLILFGIPHFDKVAHFGAYAIWSFLFLFAAQKAMGSFRKRMWWIVILLIFVGCSLEYLQYYLHEGRSFEILDMVANGAGVLGGAFAAWIYNRRFGSEVAAKK